MDGLRITAPQSVTWNTPSTSSAPAGVCIQLLATRIQKAELSVPRKTMTVAAQCQTGFTLFQPNSITPMNPASTKNAVSTSMLSSGPRTGPVIRLNVPKLVPSW